MPEMMLLTMLLERVTSMPFRKKSALLP